MGKEKWITRAKEEGEFVKISGTMIYENSPFELEREAFYFLRNRKDKIKKKDLIIYALNIMKKIAEAEHLKNQKIESILFYLQNILDGNFQTQKMEQKIEEKEEEVFADLY